MGYEIRDTRHGLWDTGNGIQNMSYKTWATRHKLWDLDYETYSMRHGLWDMGFNVKLGPSPKLHFLSGRVMTDRDGTGWDGWDGTGWVVTNWNVTGWDGRDGSGWVRTGPENKKKLLYYGSYF